MTLTVPLQFGIPGGPELLIILLIAVLLFGANKIPKLARSTGEAMGEFQKGREEVEEELQEMRDGSGSADTTPEVGSDAETESAPEIETADESDDDASEDEDEFEIADAEADDEANR